MAHAIKAPKPTVKWLRDVQSRKTEKERERKIYLEERLILARQKTCRIYLKPSAIDQES